MISATSFANELKEPLYVFRMVPQIIFFATQLSNGIDKSTVKPKVAICIDRSSLDQITFKKEFQDVLLSYKGQYIDIPCNIADPSFKPITVVEVIRKNNANSLMWHPM